jgi:hypothetical protein
MASRAITGTDSDMSGGDLHLMQVSQTRQTDRQTYVAYRLHDVTEHDVRKLFKDTQFFAGFEFSQKHKEHCHVIMLDDTKYACIDKRISRYRKWPPAHRWSSPNYKNDLLKGISYTAKDGKIIKSDDWPIDEYPTWIPKSQFVQTQLPSDPKKSRDWQLTYANLVNQALQHHRKQGLAVDWNLKQTVQHMLEHTPWRPSHQLVTKGVVDYYYQDFEFRKGKRPKFDMDWMTPKL